jgi:predicted alpha/beta-hydrolase family hydrolase
MARPASGIDVPALYGSATARAEHSSFMPTDIRISIGAAGETTAVHYSSITNDAWRAVLILAHGAGAGQRHPFMVDVASCLAAAGVDIVTFDFPYMERGGRIPDRAPVLEQRFRRVVEAIREQPMFGGHHLFIGGKSMGGRMATHLAAQGCAGVEGIVILGYPLHPPGKPDRPRVAHLPSITLPVLIVQGERDAFGTPTELEPVIETMQAPVTLHVVAGGDHSLAARGRPPEQNHQSLSAVIRDWMRLQMPASDR